MAYSRLYFMAYALPVLHGLLSKLYFMASSKLHFMAYSLDNRNSTATHRIQPPTDRHHTIRT